jgi:cell division control protein 11
MLPFSLVGTEQEIIENGRKKRGRSYVWGFVDVDNPKHSDFTKLRSCLLK